MTQRTRNARRSMPAAGLGGLIAGLLLIIAISQAPLGQQLQGRASALVHRVATSRAVTPAQLVSDLQREAPAGSILRLNVAGSTTLGGAGPSGVWTTVVAGARSPILGPVRLQIASAGAPSGASQLGFDIAIASCMVALLALLALFVGAGAAPRADLHRDGTQVPEKRHVHAGDARSDRARRQLTSALMVVIDTLPDSPAGARALRAFEQIGIETISPRAGDRFDARMHCVCGVVDTTDARAVDTIAAVVRPGFIDGGIVLREADVQIHGNAPATISPEAAISTWRRP